MVLRGAAVLQPQKILVYFHYLQEVDAIVHKLNCAPWQRHYSRPPVDSPGYFLVLHWYVKEKVWVPLYIQHGNVASQLTKMFKGREAIPICKYLSSFPHSERKRLWFKWLLDSPSDSVKNKALFEEVHRAYSVYFNYGELLPFNMDDDQPDVPENFSLLDC